MFLSFKFLILINLLFFIGLLINNYHLYLISKDNKNLNLTVEYLIIENNNLKQIISNNNQAIYNRFVYNEKIIIELAQNQALLAEGFVPLINENNELDRKLQEFLQKNMKKGNL